MAQKITGAQIEYDANAPLIDVDTAIEDLAEDLNRAGRIRQLHALRHLVQVASRASSMPEGWVAVVNGALGMYEFSAIDWSTRSIMVNSKTTEKASEDADDGEGEVNP